MLALLYGPLLLVILFGFSIFVFITIALCVKVRGHLNENAMYRRGVLETLLLIAYTIIDSIICSLLVVNRIYYLVYIVPNELHPMACTYHS